jgi:hypothetical protein
MAMLEGLMSSGGIANPTVMLTTLVQPLHSFGLIKDCQRINDLRNSKRHLAAFPAAFLCLTSFRHHLH